MLSSSAKRRIIQDYKECTLYKRDALSSVSAKPYPDSFLTWAVNLCPTYGPYQGSVFHLLMTLPPDYPTRPPSFKILSTTSSDGPDRSLKWHPNVFGEYVCLSVCRLPPDGDWSSSYTLLTVLMQLQSFLFAENIPQEYGGNLKQYTNSRIVSEIRARNASYSNAIQRNAQGTAIIVHTQDLPWPPLEIPITAPGNIGVGCSIESIADGTVWGVAIREEPNCWRL